MSKAQFNVWLTAEHLGEIDDAVDRRNRKAREDTRTHRPATISRTSLVVDAALADARSDDKAAAGLIPTDAIASRLQDVRKDGPRHVCSTSIDIDAILVSRGLVTVAGRRDRVEIGAKVTAVPQKDPTA